MCTKGFSVDVLKVFKLPSQRLIGFSRRLEQLHAHFDRKAEELNLTRLLLQSIYQFKRNKSKSVR